MASISRADLYTQPQKTPDIFSDFLNDFRAHPITGDVARIRNENSIKQSIKNLVYTNYGERFFQPSIGSHVMGSLFEMADSITADDLAFHIQQTLQNCEPRIHVLNVVAVADATQQTVVVNIVFSIINTTTIQNVDILLKRVR